jgi:hypothetical protein
MSDFTEIEQLNFKNSVYSLAENWESYKNRKLKLRTSSHFFVNLVELGLIQRKITHNKGQCGYVLTNTGKAELTKIGIIC